MLVTHGLYPPEEAERVRQAFANRIAADDEVAEASVRSASARQGRAAAHAEPGWIVEVNALKAEVAALRAAVEGLSAELHALKSELGAS